MTTTKQRLDRLEEKTTTIRQEIDRGRLDPASMIRDDIDLARELRGINHNVGTLLASQGLLYVLAGLYGVYRFFAWWFSW